MDGGEAVRDGNPDERRVRGQRRGALGRAAAQRGGSTPLIAVQSTRTTRRAAPGGSATARGGARAATMNRVRLRPCSAARPRSLCLAALHVQLTITERAFRRA